jgi:NCAIR mutase (PurE)-related protein
MDPKDLRELLQKVRDGALSPESAAERLKSLPYEDLGFAKVDHHRALRRGFPEAIFGAGKTPEQIAAIADRIAGRGQNVLVTRTTEAAHQAVVASWPAARFHELARCVTLEVTPPSVLPGRVAVVCAGTSDVPASMARSWTESTMWGWPASTACSTARSPFARPGS